MTKKTVSPKITQLYVWISESQVDGF